MNDRLNTNTDLDAIENIVHPDWEFLDPTPNLKEWANKFDVYFFDGLLANVKFFWSKKLTKCAGITYEKTNEIVIRLSEPVLRYLPRKSVIETLLVSVENYCCDLFLNSESGRRLIFVFEHSILFQHEMIHAHLMVTKQPIYHGKQFKAKMKEINERAGTNITIEHHFNQNAEIYFYRCNGRCRDEPPRFGWVKTQDQRAPNPRWGGHRKKCDGNFYRIYDTDKAFADSDFVRSDIPLQNNLDSSNAEVNMTVNTGDTAHNPSDPSANERRDMNICSAMEISKNIKREICSETDGEPTTSEINLITDFDAPIVDEMFANFHDERKKLLSVESLIVKPVPPNDRNYCILCQDFVADDQLFQHLFECVGFSVEQLDYRLPFYRVPSII